MRAFAGSNLPVPAALQVERSDKKLGRSDKKVLVRSCGGCATHAADKQIRHETMNGFPQPKWLSRRGYSALVKSSIGQSIGRRKTAPKLARPSDAHAEGNVVAFKPRPRGDDDVMVKRLQAN